MMRSLFATPAAPLPRVHAASARWVAGALALTLAAWLAVLAGLHVADGPPPPNFGLTVIPRNQRDDQWAAEIGSHPHYANWNLSGPKARFETAALCDMVALTRKLVVVVPPWAPRYDRARDAS